MLHDGASFRPSGAGIGDFRAWRGPLRRHRGRGQMSVR